MSFPGKLVIVTGASSGIGAATAVIFAKEGASVTLVARYEAKLANIGEQCALEGPQPFVIKVDVANEEEASIIVKKTIDKLGKLDVLVNNAGILRQASVDVLNIRKTFDEMMKETPNNLVGAKGDAAKTKPIG